MKKSDFSIVAVVFGLSLLSSPLLSDEPVATVAFSEAELSEKWTAAKGKWQVADGKLKGAEVASDDHAAVMNYKAPHTDTEVSLKFQLAGSKGFHLSFNHPKGHLFRVLVSENGVALRLDKDKKDPKSKPETLATAKGKFEQGKWYTMKFSTKGETATAEFDNGVKLEGSHANLTKKKTGFRLVLKGDGVLFDDFTIASLK